MAAKSRRLVLDRILAFGILVGTAALAGAATAAPADDVRTCGNASGEAAIAACTRAIESGELKGRGLAGLHIMRAVKLSNKGELERAIVDYNQAVRLDPNYAAAYSGRAMAYRDKGDLDRAIADYGQAIRLDPKRPFLYHLRGNAYRAKDEIDRAIADYDQALRLDPTLAAAYYDRGFAHELKIEMGRAVADYDQAIRLNPKVFRAYANRGLIHLGRGEVDRAIADYDAALRLNPKQPQVLYGRGVAKLRKGDARGNGDIAAAKALQGDIAEMFARAGVVAPGSAVASTPAARSETAPAPAPLPAPKLQPAPLPPVALAQTSVKAIFEKHNLLGIFAWDCGKPASKDNLYYVNRLLDGDRVQRDQMSGPTTRDVVTFIDKAAESSNLVAVSGMRDGKPTDMIWRVERNPDHAGMRVLGVEASWGGQKLIGDGKLSATGKDVPWIYRCDAPG